MLNSPFVPMFVQNLLEIIHVQFLQSIIWCFIDAILLTKSKVFRKIMFKKVKKVLPYWGLQIAPKKVQRGGSINYIGYKLGLQKIRPQKV